jgi:hypothetical protein
MQQHQRLQFTLDLTEKRIDANWIVFQMSPALFSETITDGGTYAVGTGMRLLS